VPLRHHRPARTLAVGLAIAGASAATPALGAAGALQYRAQVQIGEDCRNGVIVFYIVAKPPSGTSDAQAKKLATAGAPIDATLRVVGRTYHLVRRSKCDASTNLQIGWAMEKVPLCKLGDKAITGKTATFTFHTAPASSTR
jgi:hypothetical protein